jgi:hypothetical protein
MQDGGECAFEVTDECGALLARPQIRREHDTIHESADRLGDFRVPGQVGEPFHRLTDLAPVYIRHPRMQARKGRERGSRELRFELLAPVSRALSRSLTCSPGTAARMVTCLD